MSQVSMTECIFIMFKRLKHLDKSVRLRSARNFTSEFFVHMSFPEEHYPSELFFIVSAYIIYINYADDNFLSLPTSLPTSVEDNK